MEKPFLKWVGGKTQILKEVLELFPKSIHNYHEPFLGGGSVLLALLTHVANGTITVTGKIYASDINKYLIALYKHIQHDPDGIILEMNKLLKEYAACTGTTVNRKAATLTEATSPESYYFWIRSKFNTSDRTSIQASAMLLFMNKTCFRGVYREGPSGINVPFGNYKKTTFDEEHIRRVSRLIKDVVFTPCTFQQSLLTLEPDDFVYLDPPYAPENSKSFVSYTADGFDQHKELFQLCHGMKEKKVGMLMSNADVTLVKEAFPSPYTTQIISCRRAIHSKEPDARANEVLIY